MANELGVFDVRRGLAIPEEARYATVVTPAYNNPNRLTNPEFELGLLGWPLHTPSGTTPMTVNILPGYAGNSAVMVSNELGYKGGLWQTLGNLPPNTTLHFKAIIKTVNISVLRAVLLHYSIRVGGAWHSESQWGVVTESRDWALYEVSITTPDEISSVNVFPATIYNQGEVWIDEVSLTIEGWRPSTIKTILNWHQLHRPFNPFNQFVTEDDIKTTERGFLSILDENLWGILFISEEHYRVHINFNDDVDTTWFGERLLGFPLYQAEEPAATVDDWMDEMFLRMIRGFYNYFSPRMKVGTTAHASATVLNWKNQGWSQGIPRHFGAPAMDFIMEHYDFVLLYAYTTNLQFFNDWTKQYFTLIDQLFQNQQKFWITTLPFGSADWEPEAIALETKNCFDRNIDVLSYYVSIPPLEEVWPLLLRARGLYDLRAPYTESLVHDTNLLTGYANETYGWVANPEHDEDLYPMPIFPLGKIIFPIVIGGLLFFKIKGSK